MTVSVPNDFPSNSKQFDPIHCKAYDYSCAGWHDLHDHLRDFPWKEIFALRASLAASEFCGWVQVGSCIYCSSSL